MYPLRFPAAERRYLSSTPRKAFATSRRSAIPSGDNVIPHRTSSFHAYKGIKPGTTLFNFYRRHKKQFGSALYVSPYRQKWERFYSHGNDFIKILQHVEDK